MFRLTLINHRPYCHRTAATGSRQATRANRTTNSQSFLTHSKQIRNRGRLDPSKAQPPHQSAPDNWRPH
ncbi:MAG: hypothetical protein KDA68_21160, partial [Planctomycetaceae bacterium]|nr:hypothetical protein [Planctomycetaceae bacterium]